MGLAAVHQNLGGLKFSPACTRGPRPEDPGPGGQLASSGVIDLNFARTGQVATISVRAGQNVTSGQVLATEAAVPAATAVVASDKAAIGVDEAALAQFGNQSLQAEGISLATAQAKLAKDKAQLALDQAAVVLGDQPDPPLSGMMAAVQLAS